ncbi:hypothetical protein QL285_094721 [Trifolium repens]|nr:hypothetical protein QL285_094721 [Trifolium repens]
MTSFNIPWKCLDLDSEPKNTIIDPPKPTVTPKTFAQALTNLCDIPLSQFPQPVVKGDRLAIEILEVAYQAGLDACKHNLHGRIVWPKGSTLLSVVALKEKLSLIWKDFSKWGVISLGKGFFEFTFSTLEDVRRVRSIPSWNINPGMLKLFAWTKDFNPKLQHNTSAQVWVKFFGLSQEYWHKNILFAIASSIGTPICIDSVTAKPMHETTFGQFARVLVDMDLSQPLRFKVLVERKGFAFFVELEYENVPDFCNNCQVIGHHVDNCRRWNKDEMRNPDKEIASKKKPTVVPKKMYVHTNKAQQSKENEVIKDSNIEANKESDTSIERDIINVEDSSDKSLQSKGKEVIVADVVEVIQVTQQRHVDVRLLTKQATNSVTVLSPVESPRAILKNQDQQLEADLNRNRLVDDTSDSDDSFVDTTQFQPDTSPALADPAQQQTPVTSPATANTEQRQIPVNVVKDMVFLKES